MFNLFFTSHDKRQSDLLSPPLNLNLNLLDYYSKLFPGINLRGPYTLGVTGAVKMTDSNGSTKCVLANPLRVLDRVKSHFCGA